jgi:ABC-type nickel/cobalt efflux system permease component RcnA
MPEEVPITASFVLTLDEIKKVQALFTPKLARMQVVVSIVFILGISPIVIGILSHRIRVDPAEWTLPKVAVFLVFFGALYAFFRYQRGEALKKAFTQNPAHDKHLEYRFSPGGVSSTMEGVKTQWQWNAFMKVRRTRDGYLFLETEQVGFWIPNHAFRSQQDADALAELARKSVPRFMED